jgi:hypothetical protein
LCRTSSLDVSLPRIVHPDRGQRQRRSRRPAGTAAVLGRRARQCAATGCAAGGPVDNNECPGIGVGAPDTTPTIQCRISAGHWSHILVCTIADRRRLHLIMVASSGPGRPGTECRIPCERFSGDATGSGMRSCAVVDCFRAAVARRRRDSGHDGRLRGAWQSG